MALQARGSPARARSDPTGPAHRRTPRSGGRLLGMAGYTDLHSGKVRDLYVLPDGNLLMVASDRISAFDFILPTPIPDKGQGADRAVAVVVRAAGRRRAQPRAVHRRARGVRRARDRLPTARDVPGRVRRPRLPHRVGPGRLPGHRRGVRRPAARRSRGRLPRCRRRSSRRPPRPSSASTTRTSTYDAVAATVGTEAATALRTTTLAVYERARDIALERGIVVADTKLEFGRDADGALVLARRGAHAGLVAVLAGRPVAAGARRSRRTTSSTSATG